MVAGWLFFARIMAERRCGCVRCINQVTPMNPFLHQDSMYLNRLSCRRENSFLQRPLRVDRVYLSRIESETKPGTFVHSTHRRRGILLSHQTAIWLAYSKFQDGNWNLWLRDLISGQTTRLTNAACNAVEPAWASDSKTVVYASDCGRALWFTALCRRHIPH